MKRTKRSKRSRLGRRVSRRSRFGFSGPLINAMGYEFCPDGHGGVLGVRSDGPNTGLYPSPCETGSGPMPTGSPMPPYVPGIITMGPRRTKGPKMTSTPSRTMGPSRTTKPKKM